MVEDAQPVSQASQADSEYQKLLWDAALESMGPTP